MLVMMAALYHFLVTIVFGPRNFSIQLVHVHVSRCPELTLLENIHFVSC